VDLSMTTDMSAVAFVFPAEDGYFDILPFFWMPENGIKKRELYDGMPYRTWADQGLLELCPGDVIDVREIRKRLEWGDRMFDLQELCFDPSEARQLSVPMLDDGYTCIDVRQGYNMLSEPCKKILELVACGKLRHGGHPILRWNAMCLASKEHNDQLMWAKPERQKETARIDGIAATTDAMVRAMLPGNGPSVYESRGVRTV
jgi:phage terminase large subunit-like protein